MTMFKITHLIKWLSLALILFLTGCATQSNKPNIELSQARFGLAAVNDGQRIYVLGGAGKNMSGTTTVEIIDPTTGQIEVLENAITSRFYHSAVFDGDESIYLIGGVGESTFFPGEVFRNPTFEVFNTKTKSVTRLGSFRMPTRINTAQYHQGKIYVLGGSQHLRKGTKYIDDVFIYDIKTKVWRVGAKMPKGKATKSVIFDDWLYTVGGYDGKASLSSFERYSLSENRWETLPDLPKGISAHAVTVNNGKLYSFGNYNSLTDCFSYDFATQIWQQLDCGLSPVRHAGATTLNGVSYIIGGTVTGGPPHVNKVQAYTPEGL